MGSVSNDERYHLVRLLGQLLDFWASESIKAIAIPDTSTEVRNFNPSRYLPSFLWTNHAV